MNCGNVHSDGQTEIKRSQNGSKKIKSANRPIFERLRFEWDRFEADWTSVAKSYTRTDRRTDGQTDKLNSANYCGGSHLFFVNFYLYLQFSNRYSAHFDSNLFLLGYKKVVESTGKNIIEFGITVLKLFEVKVPKKPIFVKL